MFAMRELSGPLSVLIEMTTCGSFCNEPFSLGVLQLLKVQMKAEPCAAEPPSERIGAGWFSSRVS